MSRTLSNVLTAAIRAPFWKKSGLKPVAANTTNATYIGEDWRYDNGFQQRWENSGATDCVRGLEVDSSNNVFLREEAVVPMRRTITFNLATAASLVTQHFFVADRAYRISGITEIHATAETTAATLTGNVVKIGSGIAPSAGQTVMTGTFNMKATANTLQTATLFNTGTGDSDEPFLQLATGDRLGFVFSAAGTEMAGVVVEIALAPSGVGETAIYNMQANGDLVDQQFFIANRPFIVTGIVECHSTAGTSTPTLDVKKCTGTQAAASGTTLLASTFLTDSTINVPVTGTLSATASVLRLDPGDRLAIDFTGTTTLAGVVVTVTLQAVERRKEVSFVLSKNANQAVDQSFFTADRNYEVVCVTQVHSVAAGGASKLQVTRDKATDAPGAGVDLIGLNSAAGFDLAATAQTVQVCTTGSWPAGVAGVGFVDPRFNYLMAGDRLSVDYANAAQSTAGVVVTATLRPC